MSSELTQRIVVIDDDADFCDGMKRLLRVNGYRNVDCISSGVEALESLEQKGASVIFLDMVMPGLTGRDILPILNEKYPDTPVVISTAVNEVDNVVSCMKSGAYDYLVKPVDTARLLQVLGNALRLNLLNQENRRLKDYLLGTPLSHPELFSPIITRNGRVQAIFKLMETFAKTLHPILITGETGVGKELAANVIHAVSGVKGPFVAFDAGGLDGPAFVEALFGKSKVDRESGDEERSGLIQKAQGGTLFLDEVADLGHDSQIALLRLLQEGEYYRPSSNMVMRSNARIVAASNRDMKELLDSGRLRRDLYHRLSAHQFSIPPLRERREDIIPIARHYAALEAEYLGKTKPGMSAELIEALTDYDYPGNVRELINMVRNGVALNRDGMLTCEDFAILPQVRKTRPGLLRVAHDDLYTVHAVFEKFPSLEEFEKLVIEEAIKFCGSKTGAAEILGISRPTLNKKLQVQTGDAPVQ